MRIKQLRIKSGLTQKQLAEKIGTSKSNVSKYENLILEPNIQTLCLMASIFDVSIEYLIGKNDDHKAISKIEKTVVSAVGELSPEGQQKAIEYIEMLKTLEEVETGKNCIDFREKA